MIWQWILALLKWAVALSLIGGLLFVAYRVHGEMRGERQREGEGDRVESPERARGGAVMLSQNDATRYGLQEEPARAVSWTEREPVYGQVIPNPKATVEIRSPFAGTLRAAAGAAWPAPGQWVRAGQVLGWVDIRISAQERLTLLDNLNNARLKKQGARKVVELQRERVNRVEKLSRSQIVPGQQLDDAKVLLAEAETQLAIASAAVELWEKALAEADRPGGRESSAYSRPLEAPADGEVIELAARPGMAIEAGALVAQIVDFRRALVRLNLPPETMAAGPPARVELFPIPAHPALLSGVAATPSPPEPAQPVWASLVGPAPRVDETTQFIGYWYATELDKAAIQEIGNPAGPRRDRSDGVAWRPGLLVKAYLSSPAVPAQPAVLVPATALLFHQGRPLVYVRTAPGTYGRREVRLLGREGDFWIVAQRTNSDLSGLAPGEAIVRSGAQVLLSEEFLRTMDTD